MTDFALTAAQRRRSLFAVIASMTAVDPMYGMSVPLLPLVLERQGVDLIFAGTVFNAMWSIGGVAGPPLGGLGIELANPHGMIAVLGAIWLFYLPIPVAAHLRRRQQRGE